MGVEIKRNTKVGLPLRSLLPFDSVNDPLTSVLLLSQLVLDKSPMPAAKGQPHMVQSWIHRSDLLLKEIKGIINADWAGVLVILVSAYACFRVSVDGAGTERAPLRSQTQGTKEAVADLGRRLDRPGKTPYRLLRERSRPGEMYVLLHCSRMSDQVADHSVSGPQLDPTCRSLGGQSGRPSP